MMSSILKETFLVSMFVVYCIFFTVTFYGTSLDSILDQEESTISKWVRKFSCKHLRVSNKPLPLTALAGYPGSGNTWFRHLLQQATGILTGSVYKDNVLQRYGFPANGVSNDSVLIVKVHHMPEDVLRFAKVILLLRDPRDAILAEFNRQYGRGHVQIAPEHIYEKHFAGFFKLQLDLWNNTYTTWLAVSQPLLLVRYEDMLVKLREEMTRVFEFLEIKVSDKDMDCMLANQEGLYHRKKTRQFKSSPVLQDSSADTFIINTIKTFHEIYIRRRAN